jgi:predicted membrane protein
MKDKFVSMFTITGFILGIFIGMIIQAWILTLTFITIITLLISINYYLYVRKNRRN